MITRLGTAAGVLIACFGFGLVTYGFYREPVFIWPIYRGFGGYFAVLGILLVATCTLIDRMKRK